MTKQKISITIDENMVDALESMLKGELFRNRSHIIEFALNKFMEKKRNIK
ncbi:ribbon-helix-helix protein, CopG family [Candidatus Pacearchaeota archaeon]|nr:ribbon-helix-helix protein, CopG family [Candidatus Pacearchaeota archaeon]